jgi:three-Cys-motif partner protein
VSEDRPAGDAELETIGEWSVRKSQIVESYAAPYLDIVRPRFRAIYMDAFAGEGLYEERATGAVVEGTALRVTALRPGFHEHHLIDNKADRIERLRSRVGRRDDVRYYPGDANQVLVETVLPLADPEHVRALCFLDPYGVNIRWGTIARAAAGRHTELFIHFAISGVNRNAKGKGEEERIAALFGNDSWRPALRKLEESPLLGADWVLEEKVRGNDPVVEAFRKRLREVFDYVAPPQRMRKNKKGPDLYYLFFASQNAVGAKIAADVLKKHGG